jgi:hypothetical protein
MQSLFRCPCKQTSRSLPPWTKQPLLISFVLLYNNSLATYCASQLHSLLSITFLLAFASPSLNLDLRLLLTTNPDPPPPPLVMTKMPPPPNTSLARKKDKKVEVSIANWMLGGSLLSVNSNTSSTQSLSRRVGSVKSVCRPLFAPQTGCFMKRKCL